MTAGAGRGRATEHVWEALRVTRRRMGEEGGSGEVLVDGERRVLWACGVARCRWPCQLWRPPTVRACRGLGRAVMDFGRQVHHADQ